MSNRLTAPEERTLVEKLEGEKRKFMLMRKDGWDMGNTITNISDAIACIREQQAVLEEFMRVTENGTENGMYKMHNFKNRIAFYDRVDSAKSKARATLARWRIE